MRKPVLRFLVTEEEKRAFHAARRLTGFSLSVWMRHVLRQAATQQLNEAKRPNPLEMDE